MSPNPLQLNQRRRSHLTRLLCISGVLITAVYALKNPARGGSQPVGPDTWDSIFWLMALEAFVLSWWIFEALFRDQDGRRIILLPLKAEAWTALVLRRIGIGLVLAQASCLALGLQYSHMETPNTWVIHSSVMVVYTWALWGLSFGFYTHLLSTLERPGPLRELLKGGLPSPEAALLFYGPSFGFLAGLILALFMLFSLRLGLGREESLPVLISFCVPFLLGTAGLMLGRRWFTSMFPVLFPRFLETERVLPFADREIQPLPSLRGGSITGGEAWKRSIVGSLQRAYKVDSFYVVCAATVLAISASDLPPRSAMMLGVTTPLIYPFVVGGTFRRLFKPELIPDAVWKPGAISSAQWLRALLQVGVGQGKGVPTLLFLGVVSLRTSEHLSLAIGFGIGLTILFLMATVLARVAWKDRARGKVMAEVFAFITTIIAIAAVITGGT